MADNGPKGVPMALWPEVTVIPGAAECLAALHDSLPLCIATNAADSSREMIERALERGGLLAFFSQVFCFSEIGATKSQPELWHAVQEQLGVPLSQVVMVGDSLEGDVLAPQRFGLQVVWFNQQGRHTEPPISVPTVTNLEQLARLVKNAV
jgi:putative hydrolase of the HAD superfamily